MNRTLAQASRNTQLPWRDYVALTKPRVVALLMLTAIVGMYLATPEPVPLQTLVLGSTGFAMAMGGAAAINQVVDQRIDAIMTRTQTRPLAGGRIASRHALLFAGMLMLTSMWLLGLYVNILTALLTLFGFVGYAIIYTLFLKRATPHNIVLGGFAGALPPLLGWTAVTGEIHPHALLLVIIIFLWTPPHFWPLAIHRVDEYAQANIPMLPVTHGSEFTKTAIIHYALLLCIATMLPFVTGMSGMFYFLSAIVLNLVFFVMIWRFKYAPTAGGAMRTFTASIVYLALLFATLLIDHIVFPLGRSD